MSGDLWVKGSPSWWVTYASTRFFTLLHGVYLH